MTVPLSTFTLVWTQGSITSTLLCSLYFADLEARYLRPVLPNHPNHPNHHNHPAGTLVRSAGKG